MQGRKLITLGIFKLERNMQKQCLCGCFMFFSKHVWQMKKHASHINDDHIYYNML